MQNRDTKTRYGWISIGLHWFGAIAVVMLWFIGNVMTAERTTEAEYAELVRVHMSVAVSVYLLLVARIVHRFVAGFPDPVGALTPIGFMLTRLTQYMLLLGIALMLISGPLMVWSEGEAIQFFGWNIGSPFAPDAELHDIMAQTHRATRWALLAVALAHIAGIFSSGAAILNRMLMAPEDGALEESATEKETPN